MIIKLQVSNIRQQIVALFRAGGVYFDSSGNTVLGVASQHDHGICGASLNFTRAAVDSCAAARYSAWSGSG